MTYGELLTPHKSGSARHSAANRDTQVATNTDSTLQAITSIIWNCSKEQIGKLDVAHFIKHTFQTRSILVGFMMGFMMGYITLTRYCYFCTPIQ